MERLHLRPRELRRGAGLHKQATHRSDVRAHVVSDARLQFTCRWTPSIRTTTISARPSARLRPTHGRATAPSCTHAIPIARRRATTSSPLQSMAPPCSRQSRAGGTQTATSPRRSTPTPPASSRPPIRAQLGSATRLADAVVGQRRARPGSRVDGGVVAPWVRRAVDGTAVHRRRVAIRCFDTLVWKPWHLMAKDAMHTVWLVGGGWYTTSHGTRPYITYSHA